MKRLVAVLAIVVLSAAPVLVADANHSKAGQRLTHGEWSVPADHQYQSYRPESGQYTAVQAAQVLDHLVAGAWIYDQTDNLWVQHPSVGKNPLYLAGTAPAQGQTAAASGWQRIHGTVQSVQGPTLTIRADDGRTLTVDMAQVSPNVQRAIIVGEGVEVIGHYAPPTNQQHVAARWIQQDSSNPARGGRISGARPPAAAAQAPPPPASPSASAATKPGGKVDEKAWQRIHGKVESISGSTLRLKADDGRNLSVDMSKVSAGVQKGLTQGESVTVIGHHEKDRNHVDAQFIQQDRAGGAASPKTEPKKK